MHGVLERKGKKNTGAPASDNSRGQRLGAWLQRQLPQLTTRQVEQAIARGWVRDANGRSLKKGDRRASWAGVEWSALNLHLESIGRGIDGLGVSVLYETDDIWVVDKPAGMPGHPLDIDGVPTLTHWALSLEPGLATRFGKALPELTPHRLDTGTSGLMIVCRHPQAYGAWRTAFENKAVRKRYLAWCWGPWPFGEHWKVLDGEITKAPGKPDRWAVADGVGRRACTRVRLLKSARGMCLVEADSETGVTHQIRVHLSHAGCPLVGDRLYDLGFSQRSQQPAHHLLRATYLEALDSKWEAPSSAFHCLFD